MISFIGIIGTFPIVIVFGICSIIILRSYLKNPNRTKIYFMLWTLAAALIYLVWGLRVIFLSKDETDKAAIYPFWALSYAFGAFALIVLALASLDLAKMKDSLLFKIIRISIVISCASVFLILLIGNFKQDIITFMDVTDLTIDNPFVYYYFTCLILFYTFFPNAINIRFLIRSTEKGSFTHKRIRIVELGILIWSICILLDGMRFPSNIGILIIRIIFVIGGLITMKGFLMKPPQIDK